jgi:methylase of polypeptide subunit release factors
MGAQLALAEETLAAAESPAPRKEAVELLSHLLSVPGSELLAKLSSPMRPLDAVTYAAWVARRAAGEALVHITGRLEFMGLDIVIGRESRLLLAHNGWWRQRCSGCGDGSLVSCWQRR